MAARNEWVVRRRVGASARHGVGGVEGTCVLYSRNDSVYCVLRQSVRQHSVVLMMTGGPQYHRAIVGDMKGVGQQRSQSGGNLQSEAGYAVDTQKANVGSGGGDGGPEHASDRKRPTPEMGKPAHSTRPIPARHGGASTSSACPQKYPLAQPRCAQERGWARPANWAAAHARRLCLQAIPADPRLQEEHPCRVPCRLQIITQQLGSADMAVSETCSTPVLAHQSLAPKTFFFFLSGGQKKH